MSEKDPVVRSQVRAEAFRSRLRGDVVMILRKHYPGLYLPSASVDELVGLLDGFIESLCLEIEVARKMAGIEEVWE